MNYGVLAGTVQAGVARLLDGFGIPSLGAFNVLTILDGEGGALSPSVVADRMVVSRPTVTGLIDTLERRGLVERWLDAGDGRRRQIVLTSRGRRLVRRVLPEMHRFERDVIGVLGLEEQRQLLRSIAVLQQHVLGLLESVRPGIRE